LVAVGSLKAPVVEIAPTSVKSSVAGNGRASKATVARRVRDLLDIKIRLAADATDALAIALGAAFQMPPPGATAPRLRVRRVSARQAWNAELKHLVARQRKSP
jgi:crossover junction endodeoxyribonuclease RuvC